MYTKNNHSILSIPFYPYTILSNTILSIYHFIHIPFCLLPFCLVTHQRGRGSSHRRACIVEDLLHATVYHEVHTYLLFFGRDSLHWLSICQHIQGLLHYKKLSYYWFCSTLPQTILCPRIVYA